MADSQFRQYSTLDVNIVKQTSCTPTQSSPNSDLQFFIENFNPESNEECLFGSSCNTEETQIPDQTYNVNSDPAAQVWWDHDYLASGQATSIYNNCCNQRVEHKQYTHSIQESKAYNRQEINKTITKKKRKRITFTTEQIIAMEQIFKTRPYICREERLILTQRLQVCEKSIKVWFQNRRRISEKREKMYVPDSPSSVDTCDSNSDRLAFIESQINENVDSFGNVTLDDDVMTELVRLIDDHLPQQAETLLSSVAEGTINCDKVDRVHGDTYENYQPIYEPISPASVLDEFLL